MLRLAFLLILTSAAACGSSESQIRTSDVSAGQGRSTDNPSSTSISQERLPPPGQAWVIFNTDTVQAELARTPQEREQGLMYRENLSSGHGMLFIFPDSQTRSFWMRNTFIPLDIAYLDAELRIVDIQAMEPETLDGHPSARPAMFALEVPLGWFAEKGIAVGAQARVIFGPG